jgi:hypothetical protein
MMSKSVIFTDHLIVLIVEGRLDVRDKKCVQNLSIDQEGNIGLR